MPRAARRNETTTTAVAASVPSFTKETEKQAKEALMEAVQAAVTNKNKRPFLSLFHLQCSNAHTPTVIEEGLSAREQRILLFQVIAKLKEEQAAVFFEALHKLVHTIIEQQEHVPESAFMEDDEEEEEDDEDQSHEIVPDAKSAAGLLVLQYAAQCV